MTQQDMGTLFWLALLGTLMIGCGFTILWTETLGPRWRQWRLDRIPRIDPEDFAIEVKPGEDGRWVWRLVNSDGVEQCSSVEDYDKPRTWTTREGAVSDAEGQRTVLSGLHKESLKTWERP